MFATDFVSTKLHFTSLRAIFVWRELEEICLKLVLSEMEKWWWVAVRPSQGLRGDKSSKMSQHSIPALHEYVIHSHILSEKNFLPLFQKSRSNMCVCLINLVTWQRIPHSLSNSLQFSPTFTRNVQRGSRPVGWPRRWISLPDRLVWPNKLECKQL